MVSGVVPTVEMSQVVPAVLDRPQPVCQTLFRMPLLGDKPIGHNGVFRHRTLVCGMPCGWTLYQLFNFRAVRLVGAETGSAIALMATVFAWVIGYLIWPEPSTLLGMIGLAMALFPCIWMVFLGGFSRRGEAST